MNERNQLITCGSNTRIRHHLLVSVHWTAGVLATFVNRGITNSNSKHSSKIIYWVSTHEPPSLLYKRAKSLTVNGPVWNAKCNAHALQSENQMAHARIERLLQWDLKETYI
jgi:hypothetical protein